MANVDCPYFNREYKQCNFFGTYQDGGQKEGYCMSSDNWRRCLNYSNRSYEEKVTKKIRTNPDL